MKIRLRRRFSYQKTATEVVTLEPGEHDLPKDLAEKVLHFGKASIVVEKKAPKKKAKAPEDKVAKVPENKSRVAKKPVLRRGAGAKSKR